MVWHSPTEGFLSISNLEILVQLHSPCGIEKVNDLWGENIKGTSLALFFSSILDLAPFPASGKSPVCGLFVSWRGSFYHNFSSIQFTVLPHLHRRAWWKKKSSTSISQEKWRKKSLFANDAWNRGKLKISQWQECVVYVAPDDNFKMKNKLRGDKKKNKKRMNNFVETWKSLQVIFKLFFPFRRCFFAKRKNNWIQNGFIFFFFPRSVLHVIDCLYLVYGLCYQLIKVKEFHLNFLRVFSTYF